MAIDGSEFVAQVIYSRLDDDNERFHVLRVWGGTPGRHGRWHNGTNHQALKVRRLYHLRGPRRCSAFYVGPGAILATWDTLDVRPGDAITEGRSIDLAKPQLPPAMMVLSVRPKSAKHRDRLDIALAQLLSMDRSFQCSVDELTGNILLSGSGDAHVRRGVKRIEALSGVAVEAGLPLGWLPRGARATRDGYRGGA